MTNDKPATTEDGLTGCLVPIADSRYDSKSDVALVARTKAGDTSAFEQIVRQHGRQICGVAQRMTKSREDAEDITQEVFLKAFQKLHQFQGKSKLSTWLVSIAFNEALMQLRRRRGKRFVAVDEEISTNDGIISREAAEFRPNPEQLCGRSEVCEILLQMIHGLPQCIRIVFTLREIEDFSTKEIADALGLTIPAVKTKLFRARVKLRMRLGDSFRLSVPQSGGSSALSNEIKKKSNVRKKANSNHN